MRLNLVLSLIGRRSFESQASNREAVFSDLNRLQSHLTIEPLFVLDLTPEFFLTASFLTNHLVDLEVSDVE